MNTSREAMPFDTARVRVHVGGITAMDWESVTVQGIYGTYRFRLLDESPYVNEACYAFDQRLAVYVRAENGTVVDMRVVRPDEGPPPMTETEAMLARIRKERGDKQCSRIDPIRHVNQFGLEVTDCLTCGQPLEPTLKRAAHYRHLPGGGT